MVIQRLQTLYLLLAIAMVAAFLFVPFGYLSALGFDVKAMVAGEVTALVIPVAVALVLMIAAIFMFKKLPMQKVLVLLSILAVCVTIGMVVYVLLDTYLGMKPTWGGGGLMLVGALVALIAAYGRIVADQRLLRSYDRIR